MLRSILNMWKDDCTFSLRRHRKKKKNIQSVNIIVFTNLFSDHEYLNVKMAEICTKCNKFSAYKKATVRSMSNSLVTAARYGHYTCVKNLITIGAKVKRPVEAGLTPLMAVFSW